MLWTLKHPRATPEMLGYLPQMVSEHDPRPARAQFDSNYQGGFSVFKGFTMTKKGLEYPGDPPMPLLAETRLRDETIRLYDCAWVAIVQIDGTFE